MKQVYLLSFIFLISLPSFSQRSRIDSLHSLLKNNKEDTNKVIHLNKLSIEYRTIGSYDSALHYGTTSLQLAQKINYKKGITASYGSIGSAYLAQADYPKALDYYFRALKVAEEMGNKNGVAVWLGNIGIVYDDQADYPKALDYYLKALKIDEELNNKAGIAMHLGNIGLVYANQAVSPLTPPLQKNELQSKALDFYFKALKIDEERKDKNGIAADLGNMGNLYADQADLSSARPLERDSLLHLGLSCNFKALKIKEELEDENEIAITLGSIGTIYTSLGKYKEAEEYLKKAIAMDDSIGAMNELMLYEEYLSQLYDTTGKYQLALVYYKKAMALKDTLFNEEKNKEITRKEMNYEFEKKEAAQKAEQEKQQAVAEADKKKQQVILYSVLGGFLIVLLFAGFIFRALRITRTQKRIIEEQKKHVEEKQKEILDSIHYARRIQTALLPTEKYITKTLKRMMKYN